MPASSAAERWTPWALRAAWVLVLVTGGRALDTAGASGAVQYLGLVGWLFGVAAMAIPAVTSLTGIRVIVPAAVPAAVATWVVGADAAAGGLMVGASAVAALVALASPLGRAFVQASAYGDEDRHLLRPPVGYGTVAVLAWLVWAGLCSCVVVGVAAESWTATLGFGALALLASILGAPRWHRLSRRWLVLVPAGVVVHDQVVLAETLMVRRQEVTGIGLALAGTDALDLTGPAAGHAIEIRTREPVTVLVGSPPTRPNAIHLTACLVAPTRPGQVLEAANRRHLPVGSAA
jgi:hypothetical protein